MKGDISKKFHHNPERDSSMYEVQCEQVGRHRIWQERIALCHNCKSCVMHYYIANAKQKILCGRKETWWVRHEYLVKTVIEEVGHEDMT
jgi:hypothetical protein